MRRQRKQQMSFSQLELTAKAKLNPVLEGISELLDQATDLVKAVHNDLVKGLRNPGKGRKGLNAEQVLRAFILQRVKNLPLRELAERIDDGLSMREFTRFFWDDVPGHDAFHRAFARICPETMKLINEVVVQLAVELDMEDGAWTRGDTTVVETDIHYPTDSSLLEDSVRVLTRSVGYIGEILPDATIGFSNRTWRAKRRARQIDKLGGSKRDNDKRVRSKYRDLLSVTRKVVRGARAVADKARRSPKDELNYLDCLAVAKLCDQIETFASRADQVIAQTQRRVIQGDKVPASDKIVSIFEPHTDIIIRGKKRVPVEFGHKVFLAEAPSGVVYHYEILEGNPPDDGHIGHWLERHEELFGGPPELLAADRTFHTAGNVKAVTAAGVEIECLPQRGGRRSAQREAHEKSRAFRAGQRFRAGIEGRISVLSRGRGMKRCRLSGRERFEVFVAAAILANNLIALARLLERDEARRRRRKAA